MNAFEIVCMGLESPADADFVESMRPELQTRLLEFDSQDWERLREIWPERPQHWVEQLCATLSPAKHGLPAVALLVAIALDGPLDCLPIIVPKLLASGSLHAAERQLLEERLATNLPAQGHHAALQYVEWIAELRQPTEAPPIHEACEHSADNHQAIRDSATAACYYCKTVFAASLVTEFTDAGRTALCPYCGTDAVLPSSAGYAFSLASLEALNEFWFI